MTPEERERLANAEAQARGGQAVLLALLIVMEKTGTPRPFLEQVFDLAAEPSVTFSLSQNKAAAAYATRTLQVIDHLRASTLGKIVPK